MNLVNYMSKPFACGIRNTNRNFTFLGFIPLKDDYFGLVSNNVNYAAIHVSNESVRVIRSDEEEREKKMIQSGKSWLVIIYGSDNTSFMKRFDSERRMLNWVENTKQLVRDDSWLYYNS